MSETAILGLDIGGTYIKSALILNGGECKFFTQKKTPSGDNLSNSLQNIVEKLINVSTKNDLNIKAIGVGSPGIISDEGEILYSNNIKLLNFRLRDFLEKKYNLPTLVLNDASCALIAEHKCGVGKGKDNLAMFTIGTGVGVGLILNGILHRGNNACCAGGHMVIDVNGNECNCGNEGCLEKYASMSALLNNAKRYAKTYPQSKLNDLKVIDGLNLFELEKQGDIAAEMAIRDFIKVLGQSIVSIQNLLRVDRIIIGGGVSGQGKYLTDKLLKFVATRTYAKFDLAPYDILTAKLKNTAGVLGAAINVNNKFNLISI